MAHELAKSNSPERNITHACACQTWPLARLASLCLLLAFLSAHAADSTPLRAGMIGLDTSHVPAFAKLFNNPKATGELAGIRIVAGYPGGTDIPDSRNRVG